MKKPKNLLHTTGTAVFLLLMTIGCGGGNEGPSTTPVAVTDITLNKATAAINVGNNEPLIATIAPGNATNKSVTWTSDKTDIATVNKNGVVTGKANGSATITATSADNTAKSAVCTVTVSGTAASNNADLAQITVSKGKLQPMFAPSTTNYLDAPVPYSQTSVDITPVTSSSQATIKVNGTTVASGSAYSLTSLPTGETIVTIVITAADTTTQKTYTVSVYRAIPIFKTGAGEISGYTLDPREDGAEQRGVAWPSTRFTVNDNGTAADLSDDTVTDHMTGLVWLKNANNSKTWANAITYCEDLATGASASDWRLPNVRELRSLVNYGSTAPYTWLNDQGFANVQGYYYWSSTSYAPYTPYSWFVFMCNGRVDGYNKSNTFYVWPVCSGQ
jgi:hypothetical protein